MREIKFRAWDKRKNHRYGHNTPHMRYNVQNTYDEEAGAYFGELVDDPKVILMQFTGLKDKNGKEIYEGDIVKTKWQNKAEMLWVESETSFCLKTIDEVVKDEVMYGFKETEMEIIGNIYENGELLK